jgi:hypothetical protein
LNIRAGAAIVETGITNYLGAIVGSGEPSGSESPAIGSNRDKGYLDFTTEEILRVYGDGVRHLLDISTGELPGRDVEQ